MERIVFYNGEPLRYRLDYKKVKNVNIRVAPDGSVLVSANRRVAAAEVDCIVQKKAAWIARARTHYAECRTQPQMPRAYTEGEPVRLLGTGYRLHLQPSAWEYVVVEGGSICLFVKDPSNFSNRKKAFDGWYQSRCKGIFEAVAARVFPLFKQYRIPMPVFSIRRMKTRWGSCSPQKQAVTLNLYLAEAPVACIEYVIAHELAHLVHPDHSPRFYAVLDSVMPDHRERRALLREQKIDCF